MGTSDHNPVSVSIIVSSNSKRDVPGDHTAYDLSRADWDGICDHLRDVPWNGIFKLGASAGAAEFCD